jgi:hypothetical protein
MASTDMVVLFSGFRDAYLSEQVATKLNGKVVTALSKTTTHLVVKETKKGSKKIEEAREAGVKILSLEEFLSEFGLIKFGINKKTLKVKKDDGEEEVKKEKKEKKPKKEKKVAFSVEDSSDDEIERVIVDDSSDEKEFEVSKAAEDETEEKDEIEIPTEIKKVKKTRKSKNPEVDELKKKIAEMTQALKDLKTELKEKMAA